MTELQPKCNPEGIYSVKRACVELGVCHRTFMKYRVKGLIEPINPENVVRPKFTGQSIIDCWKRLAKL